MGKGFYRGLIRCSVLAYFLLSLLYFNSGDTMFTMTLNSHNSSESHTQVGSALKNSTQFQNLDKGREKLVPNIQNQGLKKLKERRNH